MVGVFDREKTGVKPKLLALELWGLGDLALATGFLRAATREFEVTLVAKPVAGELQGVLWPGVRVVPLVAPWTAFRGKYRLWEWPWGELGRVVGKLRAEGFAVGVSARRDPRDHVLLALAGAGRRVGFGRLGSGLLLEESLVMEKGGMHRHDAWRAVGRAVGLELPERNDRERRPGKAGGVAGGGGGAGGVGGGRWGGGGGFGGGWGGGGGGVAVLCDAGQRDWWIGHGEREVQAPTGVGELVAALRACGIFVGNDSGPGHVAAALGLPTFTVFGPQLPELFAPVQAGAEWIEGKACPCKPCFDACRFAEPHCLLGVMEAEVWERVEGFVRRNGGPK